MLGPQEDPCNLAKLSRGCILGGLSRARTGSYCNRALGTGNLEGLPHLVEGVFFDAAHQTRMRAYPITIFCLLVRLH
jgi:hypothetical protein